MARISWRGVPQQWDATPADDWRGLSACRDEDPDLFFPIGTTGPALLQAEQAKAICGRCPVKTECGKWADDQKIAWGVWGGFWRDGDVRPDNPIPGRHVSPWLIGQGDRIAEYRSQKMTDEQIGQILGATRSTVSTVRRLLGIGPDGSRREPAEAGAA